MNWCVSVTSSPGHVTYFIDLIYWLCPQVVLIYLIILSQVLTCFLSLCALHTLMFEHASFELRHIDDDYWSFVVIILKENVLSATHTDKKMQSFKIQSKYFSETKLPRDARVCVFVLRCSASVTVASHSWMIYFIQNFTCVYMSHQSSTPVRSLIKKINEK